MFGKQKQPPIRTLIGEGTQITGELRFADGLRIDGEVIGDVVAAGEGSSAASTSSTVSRLPSDRPVLT